MTQCKGDLVKSSLVLENTLKKYNEQTLRSFLLKNFDSFFEYISKLNLSIVHRSKTTNAHYKSYMKLQLPTTCFKVDFNDTFVTITAIEKR
jgi:hypothetical protein